MTAIASDSGDGVGALSAWVLAIISIQYLSSTFPCHLPDMEATETKNRPDAKGGPVGRPKRPSGTLKLLDDHGRSILTSRQREVYEAIVALCLDGLTPRLRDIAARTGHRNLTAVRGIVAALKAKGWIEGESNKAGAIRPAVPEIEVRRVGDRLTVATTGRVTLTADALARLAAVEEAGTRSAA